MANLYKKAAERQKIVPGGHLDENQEQEILNESVSEEVVRETAEVQDVSDNASVVIPLDEIGASRRPKKRSSTLYLSEEVLSELRKRSKKVGMSASEYLDELLKRAFGSKE